MPNLDTYILFPSSNPSNNVISNNDEIVLEEAKLISFLKQLESLVETVGCKKDTNLFYSANEINDFLENVEELNKEELYLIDAASTIDEYLQKANAINWLDKPLQSNDFQYCILDFNSSKIVQLFNHSINESLEQQLYYQDHKVLLINHLAINAPNQYASLIKRTNKSNNFPIAIIIPLVNNEKELNKWLTQNRKTRVFNLIPKHGENGKGAYQSNKGDEVSILECNKEEAQKLLKNAIGDVRIDAKRLYNYDPIRDNYILFYYEGENPQNQYHGFHISKENATKKIPNSILKRLSKNKLI